MLLTAGLYAVISLLAVLALLLFAPVRYRIDGRLDGGARVRIYAAWLFKLIRVYYNYDEGKTSFCAWIACFKQTRRGEKPEASVSPAAENQGAESAPADKKAKRKKNKPVEWSALLTDFTLETIMNIVIRFTRKLGRSLKPDRVDIDGVIGLADPCATGMLLGAYEAAAACWGIRRCVRIRGNFIQPGVRLNARVRGRLRLGALLWPFLWLFLQKPVFKVITGREK